MSTPPEPAEPYVGPRGWVRIDADDPSRLWMAGEVDLFTVKAAGPGLWEALPAVRTIEAGEMTFMDSSGLRCITVAMSKALIAGEEITVRHPCRQVLDVLRTTGLDVLLNLGNDGT